MSRPSKVLAEDLATRFRTFESTRRKVEVLRTEQRLSEHAAQQMYEALYITSFTTFEFFIEELFIGLLVEGHGYESARADVIPRATIRSHAVARELVFGVGNEYANWIPYGKTEGRAELFFRGGRPFSDLNDGDKSQLKICSIIRNAIAHRSRLSMSLFEEKVIGSSPIPPRERHPGSYLRGLSSAVPIRTRFENSVGTLLRVARLLAK